LEKLSAENRENRAEMRGKCDKGGKGGVGRFYQVFPIFFSALPFVACLVALLSTPFLANFRVELF